MHKIYTMYYDSNIVHMVDLRFNIKSGQNLSHTYKEYTHKYTQV